MLIEDDNVQRELIQHTKYLPMKYIYRIKFLPLIKYLIESRNTTVYQWRTRGHVSASVKRPPLNYKFIDAAEVNEEEPNIILRLDDDLTTTMTEGIAVKQTVNQTDVVDFDAETEID
ncbi:unnamed protein product [Rotaria sp. Silwood2]|nr:unnamed protein product [Rotaria sp. Silwood2]CAF4409185.1 unnamed protein product [Rotaria sp. Silwood2]